MYEIGVHHSGYPFYRRALPLYDNVERTSTEQTYSFRNSARNIEKKIISSSFLMNFTYYQGEYLNLQQVFFFLFF